MTEPTTCEVCKRAVKSADEHYSKTRDRPDGFWTCHPDLGRVRCAACDHVWIPKSVGIPSRCPTCGEIDDLFWADDGGWDRKRVDVAPRTDRW